MSVNLTPRMKNWISQLGVHIATADNNGWPTVIVAESCTVENSIIKVELDNKQVQVIRDNLAKNPWTALAPAQLGSVRAPYQFKGKAKLNRSQLVIEVAEIYCTKPGDEAGVRLDVSSYELMHQFEQSRWPDLEPPASD